MVGPMESDTDAVYANYDWGELLHTAGSVSTKSSSKTTLQSLTVSANAMLDYRGLRIITGGTTTGTGKSTLLFGFGASGSIMPATSWTPAANPSSWQASIYIFNNLLSPAAQFVTIVLYADGKIVDVLPPFVVGDVPVNTQIDTTANESFIIEGYVTSGSLSCDFMTVERT